MADVNWAIISKIKNMTNCARTIITLDAFVYSYKFYSGEITTDQFADLMTEEVVIAVASQTAGTVAQLLIPLPGVYLRLGKML